jgi:hypothetical protein
MVTPLTYIERELDGLGCQDAIDTTGSRDGLVAKRMQSDQADVLCGHCHGLFPPFACQGLYKTIANRVALVSEWIDMWRMS